ncbi:rhomboid family intramembrane serine protease [Hymenobacter rubripertinctus]|uniref:Rhomboid family intramembrane serine protease n=1 Tax=Hymenobacter rubripertinctus TaxID=2029981 RepID=A0A418QV45_9BACT|nr:rhomboid family intramembrane serine protease [Hymenobacter rubripertinctus]RIY09077.1 rhomboid family intramembrane serine protease [Hymenobacter rubripertinctus]
MFQLTPTVRNLLIANVVVFLIAQQVPNHLGFLALFPVGSPYFQPWQYLTHMFMHAGIGHIFSNMFGLMVFGPLLEQRWGGQRFLTFWLICGIGAGVLYSGVRYYELNKMRHDMEVFRQDPTDVHLQDVVENNIKNNAPAFDPAIRQLHATPDDQHLIQGVLTEFENQYQRSLNGPMVGASGALFGLLFAFAYLFPNTTLIVFPLPVPVKAKYLVPVYGLYELYGGIHQAPGDNIAHFAHLAGLLVGFVLVMLWERNRARFY